MSEHLEDSLWIHAEDCGDIFRLQDIIGLHPLAIEAVIHNRQPSKVEEYDAYLFTIIDGVKYEKQDVGGVRKRVKEHNENIISKYD